MTAELIDSDLELAAFSEQALDVVSRISFRDWRFTVVHKGGELFLQITFEDPDTDLTQYCRLWHLWRGIDETGIVKTAWAAVLMALEHEAREAFRYDRMKVFNPHADIHFLMGLQWSKNIAIAPDPS